MLPGRTEIPLVVPWVVFCLEFRLLVENTRAAYGGFETIGLSDRPSRHLAAVRPAAYAQTRGIGCTPRYYGIHNGHEVAIVTPSPIATVGLHEVLAIAIRAAWIHQQNLIAMRGEELRQDLLPTIAGAVIRCRPSVDQQYQRELFTRRFHQCRLDGRAIGPGGAKNLCRRQGDPVPPLLDMRQPADFAVLRPEVDFRQ